MLTRNAVAGRLAKPRAAPLVPCTRCSSSSPGPSSASRSGRCSRCSRRGEPCTVSVAVRRKNSARAVLGAVLVAAAVAAFTTRGSRLTTGPVEVRAWGLFFAAALALGGAIAFWRGARAGLGRELIVRACVAAAVGGVIGARLGWALLHPTETESFAGALAFYRGGLSVWGGFGGALLGTWLSSRDRGASLAELCDLGATSFASRRRAHAARMFSRGLRLRSTARHGCTARFSQCSVRFRKIRPPGSSTCSRADLSPNATSSLRRAPDLALRGSGRRRSRGGRSRARSAKASARFRLRGGPARVPSASSVTGLVAG